MHICTEKCTRKFQNRSCMLHSAHGMLFPYQTWSNYWTHTPEEIILMLPFSVLIHFGTLANGNHKIIIFLYVFCTCRSHTMRECRAKYVHFHVRHITFKCCSNDLLARRLWEKPNNHQQPNGTWNNITARVYPNATNCRSPLQIENKCSVFMRWAKFRLTTSRVGGSKWSPVYAVTARTFESPPTGGGESSDETSVMFRFCSFSFSFSD